MPRLGAVLILPHNLLFYPVYQESGLVSHVDGKLLVQYFFVHRRSVTQVNPAVLSYSDSCVRNVKTVFIGVYTEVVSRLYRPKYLWADFLRGNVVYLPFYCHKIREPQRAVCSPV